MISYDAGKVEEKWQKKWDSTKLNRVNLNSKKPKFYNLVMFPYPSGDKLHVGHWYNYGAADSYGRYIRMKGYNVFEPMGFDSFGLPAENYAIKTKVPPKESTDKNVAYMIKQLTRIGTIYDWDKSVMTSLPEYYKWTQWIFLELYKRGLAYKKNAPVNWCNSCKTVLANEQAEGGICERCKNQVVQKNLEQWFLKITDYSEKLLDRTGLDWPEKTILMQRNWIGRSEGINFREKVKDLDIWFEVYDSVPQTFIAQTFTVIAPDHPLISKLVKGTKYEKSVMEFVEDIKKKKMANKFNIETDMEGIFTGRYVENPFGKGDLPIWIASFVLAEYGTGVVNCSAHDERDFAFAKKYGIPLRIAMLPPDEKEAEKVKNFEYCYHHANNGVLQDPVEFKGRKWGEAREDIINYIEKKGFGKKSTNYKLRDWLISRQRYWGAPIPIVYDPNGNPHPIPEKYLPWELPTDVDFKPTGESPIVHSNEFFKRTEKIFGKGWRPEVDTMDTFMCSSWYFLRYPCNKMGKKPFDRKIVDKWLPVDMYIGGAEHACMHLLYARFLNMALYDMGHIGFKEPFKRLVHQGTVTKDGAKMSKTKGNVVSPDGFVDKYGSDVFRMYLMFMGPFTEGGDWSDKGITGIARFVERFWKMISEGSEKVIDRGLLGKNINKLIKKVTEDIEELHFNTALAAFMEFINFASKNGIDKTCKKIITQLITPFAPHLAEECHEKIGGKYSVSFSKWPGYDPKLVQDDLTKIGVQVNGKLRGEIEISKDASQEEALKLARANENVMRYLAQGQVVKEIYVSGRIVGFVVK
ncbi:leucine--tRNA ligase [Candidatus Peregrinibacteria bacterium RIFCSPLOWO2_01_FULL_39_12]|nr:MAG: leucine--tRNA ligase [Candidatus Peregrinibacteria bacterium RIFCSPLOWO2_02_FULL_39_10]OGJ43268.1 MAG: leucine--tRNA ligase [Candidatus Peregrinibacteria bacterium RIFCSPLOWO2_01_FULL_39_12]